MDPFLVSSYQSFFYLFVLCELFFNQEELIQGKLLKEKTLTAWICAFFYFKRDCTILFETTYCSLYTVCYRSTVQCISTFICYFLQCFCQSSIVHFIPLLRILRRNSWGWISYYLSSWEVLWKGIIINHNKNKMTQ